MNKFVLLLLLMILLTTNASSTLLSSPIHQNPQNNTQTLINSGKSSNWSLSDKIAAIATIGGFLQFLALIITIAVMIKTARRQLRAYVSLDPPRFGKHNLDSIQVMAKNGGQTPAYNVQSHLNYYWLPAGQDLPTNFHFQDYGNPTSPMKSIAVLNPNAEITFTLGIDPQKIESVRKKENNLFFYGHVDYRDIFGKHRTSKFCYQYFVAEDGDKIGHALIMYHKQNEAT